MRTPALFLLLIISITGNAQKLPNIQQVSLRSPTNVTVDGKVNEWGNKWQAYNKATQLYYNLANDADNLYLAVRCEDIKVIAKILAGGLCLNINTENKRIDNGPSITFPNTKSAWGPTNQGVSKFNFKVMDSITVKVALKDVKFFRLNNFENLPDTIVSIYNDLGIQAQMRYYNNALACEILIPTKLIGLADFSGTFAYQIKLPGVNTGFPAGSNPNPDRPANHPLNILYALNASTDFWGEYTLTK